MRRRPSRSSDDAASRRRWPVGAVLFGAPIGLVAIAPSAVSAPVLFAAAGAGRSVGDVSGRTLLQRISPNDVLSRVFGVLEGLTMLALVIGSVGAAILIEAYGVQAALVVVGAFLPVVILLSSGRLLSIDRSAEAPDAERLRLLRDIPFFAPLPAPAMERVLADMFPIEVPDLATQRAVVEVLGAIDDLVENKRRRVEVLEKMAKAIYREWFVHFR